LQVGPKNVTPEVAEVVGGFIFDDGAGFHRCTDKTVRLRGCYRTFGTQTVGTIEPAWMKPRII
jgi:hypothetical protein